MKPRLQLKLETHTACIFCQRTEPYVILVSDACTSCDASEQHCEATGIHGSCPVCTVAGPLYTNTLIGPDQLCLQHAVIAGHRLIERSTIYRRVDPRMGAER